MTCTCDEDDVCEIHVGCDVACKALMNPETPDEVRAAYEHWVGHRWLHGCSHGN